MDEPLTGLPPEVTADLQDAAVTVSLPAALYPREAVYGAAYVFIDRCYVLLGAPAVGQWSVTLAIKDPAAEGPTLRDLLGEFANELLSCAWRHEITKANRGMLETVTTQAFGGAMGPPSLADLEAYDFTEEAFDDPLGIAQSWEEKHKKTSPAPDATAPAAAAGSASTPADGERET